MSETWRKHLKAAMEKNNESFSDIEARSISIEQLDEPFGRKWGRGIIDVFFVWTKNNVYFPVMVGDLCDEFIGSVPRRPEGWDVKSRTWE